MIKKNPQNKHDLKKRLVWISFANKILVQKNLAKQNGIRFGKQKFGKKEWKKHNLVEIISS